MFHGLTTRTFPGGVHPPESKYTSTSASLEAPRPEKAVLMLSQHTGAPARSLVAAGDRVATGQKVGEKTGFISASVHSSLTGVVKAVEMRTGPAGNRTEAVVVEASGPDEFRFLEPLDWTTATPEALRERVGEAGIVGLGGAAFPTEVKLAPPRPVDTLLVNGCECEPYLTADHRLMLEKPVPVLTGALISARILKVDSVVVGVEDNKPDALEQLSRAARELAGNGIKIRVEAVRSKYPQGAEKNLIQVLLKRLVPPGKLPMEVGAVVSNVGTALAVCEAVMLGKPLYERMVTVSGCVRRPANLLVRIGTPVSLLVEACGGITEPEAAAVMGGPMMGLPLPSLDFPVLKGTSGLTILGVDHLRKARFEPCIRCGRCVDICPMFLQPYLYALLADRGRYEDCEAAAVMDCIECGACTYTCPANRPLTQWIKLAKTKIIQSRKK